MQLPFPFEVMLGGMLSHKGFWRGGLGKKQLFEIFRLFKSDLEDIVRSLRMYVTLEV